MEQASGISGDLWCRIQELALQSSTRARRAWRLFSESYILHVARECSPFHRKLHGLHARDQLTPPALPPTRENLEQKKHFIKVWRNNTLYLAYNASLASLNMKFKYSYRRFFLFCHIHLGLIIYQAYCYNCVCAFLLLTLPCRVSNLESSRSLSIVLDA